MASPVSVLEFTTGEKRELEQRVSRADYLPARLLARPASSYYAPAESLRGRSPDSSESAFPERIGGRSASISKELGAGATRVPYRTRSCKRIFELADHALPGRQCWSTRGRGRRSRRLRRHRLTHPAQAKVRETKSVTRIQDFLATSDLTRNSGMSPGLVYTRRKHSLALCRDEKHAVGRACGWRFPTRAHPQNPFGHGTIILLAALHRLAGKLIRGKRGTSSGTPERLRCLKQIDQEPP